MPRVSVGLPVRNGARYLKEALTAITTQDFDDMEIVISDNASTDATPEICAGFSSDPRVVYHRFESDSGALANFARVFELTSGSLFCWAAHDDRMLPGFLRRSVDSLDRNPDAAMCVTSVRFIGRDGESVGLWREGSGLESTDLRTRLRCFLRRRGWFMTYGLTRRHALDRTDLLRPVAGMDVLLLWEILLRHRFCVIREDLFEYRRFRASRKSASQAYTMAPAQGSDWWRFKSVRLTRELWRAASSNDLPPDDRAIARGELVRWIATRYWRDLVYNDLLSELSFAIRHQRWFRVPGILVGLGIVGPLRSVTNLTEWRVVYSQIRGIAGLRQGDRTD